MNWDAIAAIAELTAAGAVIASLIYLAAQIRQNTASIRAAASQQLTDFSTRFNTAIGCDPETAHTFMSGLVDPSVLNEKQQAQLSLLLNAAVRGYENAFFQFQAGTLDARTWEGWRQSASQILSSPGARVFWSTRGSSFHADFQTLVEEEILSVDHVEGVLSPFRTHTP